jgi:hypothetical protein
MKHEGRAGEVICWILADETRDAVIGELARLSHPIFGACPSRRHRT